jgi:hypothetical protein
VSGKPAFKKKWYIKTETYENTKLKVTLLHYHPDMKGVSNK